MCFPYTPNFQKILWVLPTILMLAHEKKKINKIDMELKWFDFASLNKNLHE